RRKSKKAAGGGLPPSKPPRRPRTAKALGLRGEWPVESIVDHLHEQFQEMCHVSVGPTLARVGPKERRAAGESEKAGTPQSSSATPVHWAAPSLSCPSWTPRSAVRSW